jgi:hypothetical protein
MAQTSPIVSRTVSGVLLNSALVLGTANAEIIFDSKEIVIE